MRATQLNQPTLSGDYEECGFDATGSCLWVLFSPDDAEDWVGVFGRGELGRDGTALSDEGRTACVLAGGVAYIVSTRERQLLHKSSQDQLQQAVAIPGQDLFVAADFIRLHAYGRSGLEWSSDRISLDGIRLEAADPAGVDGQVWTMEEWAPFRLEVRAWRYMCTWQCPTELR